MRKHSYVIALLFIEGLFLSLYGKDMFYPVSTIPEELKSNARSVIRKNDVVFEVFSISQAKMTVDYVITIMNKNGIDDSYLMQGYDRFTRVSGIQATVYDAGGLRIKRIPNDDIIDHSAISGFSMYEDNRVKAIDPEYRTVPFTVEYHYEVEFNGILEYPEFIPYEDYEIAVENCSFKAIVPASMPLRYQEQNITKGTVSNIGNQIIYQWQEKNLKALKREPFALPVSEYEPKVYLAPSDFEIDGYKGNAESWENLGQWNLKLLEGRDIFSDEITQEILHLCDGIEDEYEKIKLLYRYLQDNSRYISIQEGIGGWQPFPAETVHRLKYGDCKALTNYMKSLLKVIGINSFYTRVRAGDNAARMKYDFASNQFNHVFLCVPLEHDTLWLECTDQHNPFGYLGTFTDDRDALIITNDGGKVVHTPVYTAKENLQVRTASIQLVADGGGKAKLDNTYYGLFYEEIQPILLHDDADKKEMMSEWLEIPNYQLNSFSHKEVRERIPSIHETIDLQLNHYATVMGARLLLPLNLMTKRDLLPRKKEERRSDIFIRREYATVDTIIYQIPEFYRIEGVPANDGISSDFGEYWYKIEQNGKEIKYIRYFRMNKGQFDKSRYDEFYAFIEKISVMDNIKAVLVRG